MAAGGIAVTHHRGQILLAGISETLAGVEHMLGVQARLDALGQLDLVRGGQQRGLTDAVEIHPD